MNQPGLGVMLGMLGGNEDTVKAIRASLGKTISRATVDESVARLEFTDGTALRFWDDGQSCCESRHMEAKSEPGDVVGATFTDVEVAEGPDVPGDYGQVTDSQFLRIHTTRGALSIANYNEHNGYYGGFWIRAELSK